MGVSIDLMFVAAVVAAMFVGCYGTWRVLRVVRALTTGVAKSHPLQHALR